MSSHWTSFSHTKLSLPRVLKFHLRSVSVLLELVGGQYNYFCILLNFSILIVLLGVESTNLQNNVRFLWALSGLLARGSNIVRVVFS